MNKKKVLQRTDVLYAVYAKVNYNWLHCNHNKTDKKTKSELFTESSFLHIDVPIKCTLWPATLNEDAVSGIFFVDMRISFAASYAKCKL